jgi:hypothetical protein
MVFSAIVTTAAPLESQAKRVRDERSVRLDFIALIDILIQKLSGQKLTFFFLMTRFARAGIRFQVFWTGFWLESAVLENRINFRSTRRLGDGLGIIQPKVKFGGFREFP